MKTSSKVAWMLATFSLAALPMISGCADKGPPPPPPGVAVVGFVPDYCFWDGYEYVGWFGDEYYYWGPRHVWVVCDPVRVQRANVWMQANPKWRDQIKAHAQDQVDAAGHARPMPPSPSRHHEDHDDDRTQPPPR